jgi:hypothetical protein
VVPGFIIVTGLGNGLAFRHGRINSGLPRLDGIATRKPWMAGTSPAMTKTPPPKEKSGPD